MQQYSPPARITFICHQATQAQRLGRFPLDEPLEETSVAAIVALNWIAPRAQKIVSGPERRSLETAEALGLVDTVDADLRDCDYGRWKGLALEELQEREPEAMVSWLMDTSAAPHGGESIAVLMERAERWLSGQRDAGHIIAVTSAAVIRAAVICVLDSPPASFWRIDIAPLTVTDLRFNGRVWSLRSSGCGLARGLASVES